ncbi:hypothetical protein [Herbidospora cretacea]|uniref:hypothetical protein n=1 Tax=Herbidospora cretacea TaxID=28444 RepID=UPI0012FCA2E5|nr:hypothetical protein [Herbidospora cretacea]
MGWSTFVVNTGRGRAGDDVARVGRITISISTGSKRFKRAARASQTTFGNSRGGLRLQRSQVWRLTKDTDELLADVDISALQAEFVDL